MKEFYQNLKEKREEKGVSLGDIQRQTCLPIKFLEAIESGNMEIIPHGYDRIYLKRYAGEVGLDVQEVLQDYDILSGKLTLPQTKQIEKTKHKDKKSDTTQNPPKKKAGSAQHKKIIEKLNLDKIHTYFWIGFAGVVFTVIAFFTYKEYLHEKNTEIIYKEITSSAIPAIDSSSEELVLSDTNVKDLTAPAEVQPEQPQTFVVELRAVDTTWIRQIRDTKDTTEYILTKGIKHRVEAETTVKFVVGRADGIEVWMNGKNLGALGNSDQVVTSLVISKDGIEEKRLKTIKKKPVAENDSTVASTFPYLVF
jgi:cytoskeletal protein RodZ